MLSNVLNAVRRWFKDRTQITINPIRDNIWTQFSPRLFISPQPYPRPVRYKLKRLRKILQDQHVPLFALEFMRVQRGISRDSNGAAIRTHYNPQIKIEIGPHKIWLANYYGKRWKWTVGKI